MVGFEDIVVVVGVEKMIDVWLSDVIRYLVYVVDVEYEFFYGVSFVVFNVFIMRFYMKIYGYIEEDLVYFVVNVYVNGVKNFYVMFKRLIMVDIVFKSFYVVDLFKFFDVVLMCDGVVVVIIILKEKVKEFGVLKDKMVEFVGFWRVIDIINFVNREDFLMFKVVKVVVEKVYKMVGVMVKDIDFFEVYDVFMVMVVFSFEVFGVVEKGKGVMFVKEG